MSGLGDKVMLQVRFEAAKLTDYVEASAEAQALTPNGYTIMLIALVSVAGGLANKMISESTSPADTTTFAKTLATPLVEGIGLPKLLHLDEGEPHV